MPTATPEILKMQQADHDTLIRLETLLTSLVAEMRQSNSDLTKMLADHEARIRAIEAIHDRVNPIEAIRKVEVLDAWRGSIMSNWKLMLVLGSFISGVVGFVAAWLAVIYHILHLTK